MKRIFFVSFLSLLCSVFLACAPEKKIDYSPEINEKAKIAAEADARLAANKFDDAAATYQKAVSELNALKQRIPPGDPSLASLDTLINATKSKIDGIPAAKQQYEAKIAAETKKPEVIPEVKPEIKAEVKEEVKPEAKPKAKVATPKTKTKDAPAAKKEVKQETKTEIKSEPQTKVPEPAVELKKEPVKWRVVANSKLKTGEAEWHILCGDNLARIVRQDPQKEKQYLGGYGGSWYGTLKEAAEAACSK